ncbi:uncharacterized protein BJ171DRAFT_495151 [Polychytrium aggregatum]|uniref:uncharacterized protein n=1 Tax=Polychytrium aggregatum TaxID=110093 RepID=UPI0022FDD57E|nr:uncharacterized protein BJ171DRAFT_495151 [Polychytrium aggregatum]KAI9206920.1 hypothetical protein BJ171DRAFT_495151 [Polychytrium aggregatum]
MWLSKAWEHCSRGLTNSIKITSGVAECSSESSAENQSSVSDVLPLQVACLSGTIKHIHKSSARFLEGAQNEIVLPSIPGALLNEIMRYLRFAHCRHILDNSGTTAGFAAPRVPYCPPFPAILELAEAAIYLELPGLLDICIREAVKGFDSIDSFGDTSKAIVRSILRRVSIGSLCWAEHFLIHHPALTPSHDSDRPVIDTTFIWIQNYFKLLEQPPFRSRTAALTHDPRRGCILFWIQEGLEILQEPGDWDRLDEIVRLEAPWIDRIRLVLQPGPLARSRTLDVLLLLAARSLTTLELSINGMDDELLQMLERLALSKPHLTLSLNIMYRGAVCEALRILFSRLISDRVLRLRPHGSTMASALRPGHPKMSTPVVMGLDSNVCLTGGRPAKGQTPCPTQRDSAEQDGPAAPPGELECSLGVRFSPTTESRQSLADVLDVLSATPLLANTVALDLSNGSINSILCEYLSETLKHKGCSLQTLKLSNCSLPGAQIASILTSLAQGRSLSCLDISHNIRDHDAGGAEAGRALAMYLSSPSCALVELYAAGNVFSTTGLLAITDAVPIAKKLRFLDLSRAEMGLTLKNLAEKLARVHQQSQIVPIRRLVLSRNRLLPRSLGDCIHQMSAMNFLTHLDLAENMCNESVGLALGNYIRRESCVLARLEVRGNRELEGHFLEDGGCASLLEGLKLNRSLTFLDLSCQRLGDRSCRALASAISACNLQELLLQENEVTDSGAQSLQASLMRIREWPSCRSIILDLSANRLSAAGVDRVRRAMELSKVFLVHLHDQRPADDALSKPIPVV